MPRHARRRRRTGEAARAFFERHFVPARVRPDDGGRASSPASTSRKSRPRRSAPSDSRCRSGAARRSRRRRRRQPAGRHRSLSRLRRAGRRRASSNISTARRSSSGALAGRGPGDRLARRPGRRLLHPCPGRRPARDDGRHDCAASPMRPRSGQRFTGPGKMLADLGEIPLDEVTMQSIRAWFAAQSRPRRRNPLAEPLLHLLPRGAGRRSGARADRRGQGAADAGPLDRGRPAAAHVRHAVLHRRADADGLRRQAVPPADDRAGHRLGHRRRRRAATSSPAPAMRPARSPAWCATPPISTRCCRDALAARLVDEPGARKKLSDEDRVLWNLVARTAKPLQGQGRSTCQTVAGADDQAAADAPSAAAGRRAGSSSRRRQAAPDRQRIPRSRRPTTSSRRAGCRSKAASICTA